MARLNVLEYDANILRGWPHGDAQEMNYPSDANLGNGDLVVMAADGKVAAATVGSLKPFTIIRGVNDTFNSGGTGTNNLYTQVVPNIVLTSGYIVNTSRVFTGTASANGAALAVGDTCGVGSLADGTIVWSNASATNVEAVVNATVLEVSSTTVDNNGNTVTSAVIAVN